MEALKSAEIRVRGLGVVYTREGIRALEGVSFDVYRGEFLVVLGPSGCGKTTLLNAIAGLLKFRRDVIVEGSISVGGVDVLSDRNSPPMGYVTQKDTLLPWRTVLGNVELGLEIRKVPREERRKRALELLERVGLAEFKDCYPHELSGGMRKRVLLARALAYDPEVLLMDEPFASLDAQTRVVLHRELVELWRSSRKTAVFVTHDIDEALVLADRILLLTARPGTVKAEFRVRIPRPRSVHSIKGAEEYGELYRRIWESLREEVGDRVG